MSSQTAVPGKGAQGFAEACGGPGDRSPVSPHGGPSSGARVASSPTGPSNLVNSLIYTPGWGTVSRPCPWADRRSPPRAEETFGRGTGHGRETVPQLRRSSRWSFLRPPGGEFANWSVPLGELAHLRKAYPDKHLRLASRP